MARASTHATRTVCTWGPAHFFSPLATLGARAEEDHRRRRHKTCDRRSSKILSLQERKTRTRLALPYNVMCHIYNFYTKVYLTAVEIMCYLSTTRPDIPSTDKGRQRAPATVSLATGQGRESAYATLWDSGVDYFPPARWPVGSSWPKCLPMPRGRYARGDQPTSFRHSQRSVQGLEKTISDAVTKHVTVGQAKS